MKTPWSTSEYKKLLPTDFSHPTPEARLRVAAAVTTACRDASVCGKPYPFNMETVRVLLTMTDAEWKRQEPELRATLSHLGYDTVDGETRFNQVTRRR